MNQFSRRETLLTGLSIFTLGYLQFFFSACANSNSYGTTATTTPVNGGNCSANGSQVETTTLTDGHSHSIQITAVEINTANPAAVFSTTATDHSHTVQLTSQDYTSLLANEGVTVTTGIGGADNHTHQVIINCA